MSFCGVLRPGHVLLKVMDMEAALFHYKELIGLQETGRDDKGRVYLKGWDEHDHHSVVLAEADAPGMDHMAFKVLNADTLADFEKNWKLMAVKSLVFQLVSSLPLGKGFVLKSQPATRLNCTPKKNRLAMVCPTPILTSGLMV